MHDLIGDIHGHYDKLIALLEKLGYQDTDGIWRHPEGRQPFFLGDYIDRGPKIAEVLDLVFRLLDAGVARAIAGNHELNALAWATRRADDADWCRPHSAKNEHQHEETLRQLSAQERSAYLERFRRLPPSFASTELGHAFRAVHACWHPAAIERLDQAWQQRGWDAALIQVVSDKAQPLYQDTELVMKGLEVPLANGRTVPDKAGVQRNEVRAQWWRKPQPDEAIGAWMMPPRADLSDPVGAINQELLAIPQADDPLCFVGHYWMPPTETPQPIHPKVACIDFSVGLGGNLCAYRFDGESVASADKMVVV